MTIYRVTVNQDIDREDKTFTQYVETMKQAKYIVERFEDSKPDRCFDDECCVVHSITIERIHVEMK